MPTIFRKTAKGVHEIETREYRLPPRVRNALILVDGKRDVAALQTLIPQQVDATLELLFEQAFIEVVGESVAAAPARPADPGRAQTLAAPVAPSAPVAAPVAVPPAVPFSQRQRAAVRDLNDTLGPMAEALAIRMERARADAELQPLLQAAVQLIGNARGRAAAEAYARRHAL
jgi:hypothetical protein